MNFQKSSEWPLIPPPHFWKIMLRFFSGIHDRRSVYNGKNLQHKFLEWKWPPPPFGTFPKIHPFWMCKASLTQGIENWCRNCYLSLCQSKPRPTTFNFFDSHLKQTMHGDDKDDEAPTDFIPSPAPCAACIFSGPIIRNNNISMPVMAVQKQWKEVAHLKTSSPV